MQILILNGPNLNFLGKREPEIYGSQNFESYFKQLSIEFSQVKLDYFQSNHEGELIDYLQKYSDLGFDGIVFNAGAYTHTSIALADAIKSISIPVVEIHISNVHAREAFRRESFLSPVCSGTISGFGLKGYDLALSSLLKK
jgi:3-dehydroquinate dehydratase-2